MMMPSMPSLATLDLSVVLLQNAAHKTRAFVTKALEPKPHPTSDPDYETVTFKDEQGKWTIPKTTGEWLPPPDPRLFHAVDRNIDELSFAVETIRWQRAVKLRLGSKLILDYKFHWGLKYQVHLVAVDHRHSVFFYRHVGGATFELVEDGFQGWTASRSEGQRFSAMKMNLKPLARVPASPTPVKPRARTLMVQPLRNHTYSIGVCKETNEERLTLNFENAHRLDRLHRRTKWGKVLTLTPKFFHLHPSYTLHEATPPTLPEKIKIHEKKNGRRLSALLNANRQSRLQREPSLDSEDSDRTCVDCMPVVKDRLSTIDEKTEVSQDDVDDVAELLFSLRPKWEVSDSDDTNTLNSLVDLYS
ncbi:hypothetical protein SISSUDRAFT_1126095 [Sistotremastrum suecicum HHB10207 ss-3]|uniref:Uncharacterized protein n=1 Tax=Sistotremastrum suecicum HHB10207 ss-3 TaxID=1314776 RepID=A0A166GRE3_9AGAM|nr:hypothetical protein SISSUDRAFT_1126095 [Sistotremastrum suecicum HHB10207 ss-3]